jgi:hypothetical protein
MFAPACTFPAMSRKPMPPAEKKVPLAARVDPALMRYVEQMAESEDRTLSYIVERIIREHRADRQRSKS